MMQQEKSRAMLSTPERPVRNSVLAILRAMPSKRLAARMGLNFWNETETSIY